MIPLVGGWFAITTQFGKQMGTNYILRHRPSPLITIPNPSLPPAPNAEVPNQNLPPPQIVFRVGDHILPNQNQPQPEVTLFGDGQCLGPFYNYARLGSWPHIARRIVEVYASVQNQQTLTDQQRINRAREGLEDIQPFLWRGRHNDQCQRLKRASKAFACAFFLQGFTGWSAVMIAYKTPTVGIGCRAFVFIIYNLFSLISCMLLIAASYFSDIRSWKSRKNDPESTTWVDIAETCLRAGGKSLALLNAAIILISCLLQFSGVYNNCYCGSNRIGLGNDAEIVFLSGQTEADIARTTWVLGFVMALVACVWTIFHFIASRYDIPANTGMGLEEEIDR